METVYDFTLPRGYLDSAGEVHRRGKMRLVLSNPSYLTIVVLGKVVTELEGVEMVTANLIEKLFTADLAFLQDMYQRINDIEPPMMETVCPDCGKVYKVPLNFTTGG